MLTVQMVREEAIAAAFENEQLKAAIASSEDAQAGSMPRGLDRIVALRRILDAALADGRESLIDPTAESLGGGDGRMGALEDVLAVVMDFVSQVQALAVDSYYEDMVAGAGSEADDSGAWRARFPTHVTGRRRRPWARGSGVGSI